MDDHPENVDRRKMLQVIASALTLSGCADQTAKNPVSSGSPSPSSKSPLPVLVEASPEQRARRKTGKSTVALIKIASYDDNIFQAIKPFIDTVGLPDVKNKKVILKPNMVEIQPGKPIWTNAALVKAAIELVDYMGAREIIVAEGAGHMRDTEFLLHATGIGAMLKSMKIPFVDLNLQDLVQVPNPHNFSGLDPVWLPSLIVAEDTVVVSLPKLKTHHWVGITCSMKNMFGTFPGRKYGWPKNVLHIKGIPNCIIDINHLVKPAFALVDAIVSMEGDGPINGTAINTGFVALGTDLAAIDATCARAMGYVAEEMTYIVRAGQVIGNIRPDEIDLVGTELASVTQDFKKPMSYYNKLLLSESASSGS